MDKIQAVSSRKFQYLVRGTLVEYVNELGYDHDISSSAQDDVWTTGGNQRAGVPFNHDYSKSEAFGILQNDTAKQPMTNQDPASSELADKAYPPRERSGDSRSDMYPLALQAAMKYDISHPGRDSLGQNIRLHNIVNRLVAGQLNLVGSEYSDDSLKSISTRLDYRLGIMERATHYRDICDLEFATCNGWDQGQRWFTREAGTMKKYGEIRALISEARIFRPLY